MPKKKSVNSTTSVMNGGSNPFRPARRAMALEPRLLFDGAAAILADAFHPQDAFHPTDTHEITRAIATDTISEKTAAFAVSPLIVAESQVREVVFIDPAVKDWQQLAAGIKPGVEVIFLDASRDGVSQVADALAGRSDVTAVHIISHGDAGAVKLGNSTLSSASLSGYASDLARIGSGLTADGDILLYGCDVAQGEGGKAFVSALATATGADVAASDDLTGAAALGGDWNLEYKAGSIETVLALSASGQAKYDGLLGIPTITNILRQNPTFDTTNADAVTFRVTFSEAVQNVDGTDFTLAPGSVSGATIQIVTPVVNSNGTQYDVQVGGLAGTSGPLNLDVSNQQNITSISTGSAISYSNPAGGNPVSDQSYTVDHFVTTPIITGLLNAANANGDSGASASDFITNVKNLKITGTTDAGNTVQVFRNGTSIGLITADGVGDWILDYIGTTLADGTYSITATAVDVAGNTANSAPVALVIDTAAPVISSGTASDIIVTLNYTDDSQLDAINKGGSFTVKDNGVAVVGGVTNVSVDAATNTVMLTLANPVLANPGHPVTVSYSDPTGGNDANAIQDKAGNDSVSVTDFSVTNNTTTIIAPVIGNVSGSTWYNRGDAAVALFSTTPAPLITDANDTYMEGAVVTITNKDATDVLSIFGSLPSGITASAYNPATGVLTLTGHATIGDYQTALTQVRYMSTRVADQNSAVMAISSITTDSGTPLDFITTDQTLSLTGIAGANQTVTVKLDGTTLGTTTASAAGAWTYNYTGTTLANGRYTFTASDATNTAIRNVIVDTTGLISNSDRALAITLTVNDGQTNSAAANRTMNVLGPEFFMGQTTTSFLVGQTGGATSMELTGVNLVMNTTATLPGFADFTASTNINAMGFSPVDGHLYAWDRNATAGSPAGALRVIRINADGTTTYLPPALGAASGNIPASTAGFFSADVGPDGVIYYQSGTSIFRFDVNPGSATYLQWIQKLTLSASLGAADMAFHPVDGKIYAVAANLYRMNLATATAGNGYTVTLEDLGAIAAGGGGWGQYFDTNGFMYVTNGGGPPSTIYRIDLTNTAAPTKTVINLTAGTLPTTGDGGRIVTINLDFGDAPNAYFTDLATNGPRHSLLNNTTHIGVAPDSKSADCKIMPVRVRPPLP
ncbi:MAG: DUF4347 domain-containing protein [Deltaproteobacteria bacterium]|nr:DUF4347 domain-containing protein [Deltaproteobacteria bacterium]